MTDDARPLLPETVADHITSEGAVATTRTCLMPRVTRITLGVTRLAGEGQAGARGSRVCGWREVTEVQVGALIRGASRSAP